MHTMSVESWQHDHIFGQDKRRAGERRTLIVIAITGSMMVVEIIAGILFGSIALLADGLHMMTHALALAIAAVAYFYGRRHAGDYRLSFGSGKINDLAGYTSAILLGFFAVLMAWESLKRFIDPVKIEFNQAILVAAAGLTVNLISAFILNAKDHRHDHTGHSHDIHSHHHDNIHRDSNLRAAYLHVLADAVTSILAIIALLAGKHLGFVWMDPAMGIVGAILVARWSWILLRQSGGVLLDKQAPVQIQNSVRDAIESKDDARVSDLHIWRIGTGVYAAAISLVSRIPLSSAHYKSLIPAELSIGHVTVEISKCED